MYHWIGRHSKISRERREKKIIKESEMNEIIDKKRKNKEEVLECPRF